MMAPSSSALCLLQRHQDFGSGEAKLGLPHEFRGGGVDQRQDFDVPGQGAKANFCLQKALKLLGGVHIR